MEDDFLLPRKRNQQQPRLRQRKRERLTVSGSQSCSHQLLCPQPGVTMELQKTPARNLDKFIEDYLLPDTRFRRQVREAIDIICSFLKERCFRGAAPPVRVSKVVKVSSGPPASLGRGWLQGQEFPERKGESKTSGAGLGLSDVSTRRAEPQAVKIASGLSPHICNFLTNARVKFVNHRLRPHPFQRWGN